VKRLGRVLLIRPHLGDFRSRDAMEPLVAALLKALTPAQVDFVLLDERVEPIDPEAQADLIALTVETFTARRAYQLADGYRWRGIPVVMGGYHPSFCPQEALAHADAVVIGFESISPGNLLGMSKGHNLHAFDGYRSQVRILRDYGLQTWAAFILGYDHEIRDSVRLYTYLRFNPVFRKEVFKKHGMYFGLRSAPSYGSPGA